MQLSLRRSESKRGLVFKKTEYELWVAVQLSNEEFAAYDTVEAEIKNHIIAEYDYDGLELNLTIGTLILGARKNDGVGFRMAFAEQHRIPAKEEEIREGVTGFSNYLKKVVAMGNRNEGETTIQL